MTARDLEAALLARCAAVARETAYTAQDQREANVFQTAAMVVQSQFPRESRSLMRASQCVFGGRDGGASLHGESCHDGC